MGSTFLEVLTVEDISVGGVGVRVPHGFRLGDFDQTVQLIIALPGHRPFKAEAVIRHQRGAKKIIHLVGQFHSDFEGGTVAQLKARWPGVKLLVISLQRENPASLLDDDAGRADVVVYTGPTAK